MRWWLIVVILFPVALRADEPASPDFGVRISDSAVPVYLARICNLKADERQDLGMPVAKDTALTSFASFDLSGTAQVTVACHDEVKSAQILPLSSGIAPTFSGNTVTFRVAKPGQLTLEVNGNWINSLHLFINLPKLNAPKPGDPNVIYYGPGVHEVESVEVTSRQTVYLASGAIVYGKPTGKNPRAPIFHVHGANITFRGPGIIDGSLCPRGTRNAFEVHDCTNLRLEDFTVRDSSGWNLDIRRSEHVAIDNVKVFGWRGNSDGFDICNCRDVHISNCFLRTFDDLIVIKADQGQGEVHDITATHCVLWNEFAHALSLGAELREPIRDVHFSDCDIIHDKGREWLLRIYNCDSAPVSSVIFTDIRIGEARRLMSGWIGKAIWSRQTERGHIDGLVFENITSVAPERTEPLAELVGYDADHLVNNVTFRNVVIGGKPLDAAAVRQNPYVRNVSVSP